MKESEEGRKRVTHGSIPEAEIRAEVQRILTSDLFTRSDRLSRLLSFTVEEALAGRGGSLKEYVIGLEVLGKDASFDPRTDTIVRVHARRLRSALTEYYAGAGKNDPVVIRIPAGGYAPSFHRWTATKVSARQPLIGALILAGLAAAGWFGWWWSRSLVVSKPISSIAVLPFVDLGSEKVPDFFCDGLTEEIINALSKIEDFRVAARTSAFQFKGTTADIREIGGQLRVDTVLEGSIRRTGNRARISVRLIKVADGYHLWSESYDRNFADTLDLQNEIAQDVAVRLNRRFRTGPSAKVPEAYQSYLKGLFYWNRWTLQDFLTSIKHYEEAIAKDPTFALAHVGLADSYGTLGHLGGMPVREAYVKKDQALTRALQLDPDLPQARTALAMTRAYYEWNWQEAEREFRRALALQPQSAHTHRHYAVVLSVLGRFEEARKEVGKALDLDPLSAEIRGIAGHIEFHARQYPIAMEWYKKALEADPNFFRAYLGMGEVEIELGNYARATQFLDQASRLAPGNPETIGVLGYALGRSGRRREAMALAARMSQLNESQPVPASFRADVYLGLGDLKQGLDLLDEAYQAREGRLVQLKVNPRYDPLRSDPRFINVLKMLGFTL